MAEHSDQAVVKAEAATQRAEAAAEKAEKAAKRPGYLLAAGFLFVLVGAVMAFALDKSDVSVLGVSLEPLGGVLLAFGALLIAGAGIATTRFGGGNAAGGAGYDTNGNSIKAVGGLIAVLAGITAVTALTIVTLTKLEADNKESMIAVTSSAFGIISAVLGAYLGIKITADSTTKTSEEAKNAAVAEHEVKLAKSQVSAIEETVKDQDPGLAEKAKAAGQEAREVVVAQTIRSSPGDPSS